MPGRSVVAGAMIEGVAVIGELTCGGVIRCALLQPTSAREPIRTHDAWRALTRPPRPVVRGERWRAPARGTSGRR